MEQDSAPPQAPPATRATRRRTKAEAKPPAPPAVDTTLVATHTTTPFVETPPEAAPAAERAPVERPPLRSPLRDASPRAAAEARAAEIMEHLGGVEEGSDEFYIDPKVIPDGWTYEFKRYTVYGQTDPSYQVALQRMGWEAVPARRHPEMMPADWGGGTIERKGQVLMERPKSITDMIQKRDLKRARDQVRFKEEQLSSAPAKDHMPRSGDPGGDARTKPNITKSYEPMPVPADGTK